MASKGSDMSKGTVGGGGTTMLRRINVAAVLDAVRRSAPAPLRVAELVERTGLARPTVAQAVDELLDAGWLQQHGPDSADRSLGRPAIRVSLRGRAAPVLGLDVGPHRVTVGVSDLAGRKLSLVRRSGPGWTAQELLGVIGEVINEALAEAEVPAEDIAAVVAASPGIVDEHTGRVQLVPSVPGWSAIDLIKHVRGLLDCPVMLDNDANLAALAIAAARGGTGTLLAVQWGERLGAGIVIDGRLHRGTGAAGEIGFIATDTDDVINPEDSRGPLERAVGSEAIAALGRQAALDNPKSRLAELGGEQLDTADVFAAAAERDPVAQAVVQQVARTFARALAPSVLVLDPTAVVIGGGVARAGAVLLDAISDQLRLLTLNHPKLELSALAEDAVVTGAMRMALDEVWQRKLPTPAMTSTT
ncbi:ROK family transcriptional regulator [Kribbella sindirgiensis]|uniref:ROK family transcriptional regulator n=3 Tax=Kribbellaceae TaxID=2726069 RepID=A0A4R0J3E0_9ACTN|nr:ROK family transcriptional regulator [Kribbella speibonae]TCC41053.1 ROK family transcriptional regulator [Kribbella speibonae]TCC42940.1 ROK family transcriptional regulator [Kribbella sindirgiensis]